MKNENKSFGSAVKGMLLGVTVGSIATMIFVSSKGAQKVKKGAKNVAEGISSMFKMN